MSQENTPDAAKPASAPERKPGRRGHTAQSFKPGHKQPHPPLRDGLTTKQRVFVADYLRHFNATRAARTAGYKHPNSEGPGNLVKPSIAAIIHAELEAAQLSSRQVLAALGEQARANPADFFTRSGSLDWKKLRERGHVLSSVNSRSKEVKVVGQQGALHLIGKALGMFADKVEMTGADGGPVEYEVLGPRSNKAVEGKPK